MSVKGVDLERIFKTGFVIAGCFCSFASYAEVTRTPFLYENCPQTLRMSVSERQAAVQALALSIRTEIGKLSPNASAQDIEAAIVFAFSQNNASPDIALLAIAQLESDPDLATNIRRALGSARLALDTCGGGTGTAAIGQGSGAFGNSFSSTPILGVGGGGSSNYTSS